MATNPLETPKTTVRFDSLALLREELGKQTKNPERLGEFQKTIDAAIRDGEKKGIIEFSEEEWKTLITNEGLPPLEVAKKILEDKIRAKTESAEKRKGIVEELKDTAKEAQKSVGEKAEGLKSAATGKMQEWKDKVEKLKQYSKPGLWLLGIGLSLQLWGYKLGNWLSGLIGKTGAYDDKIKKIEMEKEFLKDPKAALEKYGAEAKEKLDSKKEGAVEKRKETVSKVPAIAALSTAAVGIYAVARKFLPKSVTDKITDEKDGSSILKVLKGRKFLKLFGVGGLALLGAGALFAYFSENPDKLKSLGEVPEDGEGKKSWWKKALGVAGIGENEGGNHILSYMNGEKIEEKMEQQPLEEGKVWLKDHPLYKNTMGKMEDLGNKLLLMQKENPAAFKATLAAVGLVAGASFVISTSTRAIDIAKTFLISATKSAGKHPIMWAGGLIAGISGLTALAHMQIREDASVDDIREMVGGVFDYDDFKNNIEWMPDLIEAPVDKVADCLRDNGAVLTSFISDFCDKFWEKTGQAARDWLILDTHERITSKNTEGLEAFMQDIKTNKIENTEQLCGKDKKSGVIGGMISKLKKDEKITEKDIHSLMEATKGTKIRIFPEGGNKDEGRFIQFVTLDENNQPIGMAKNICLNPALSKSSQAEASREFSYNPHETNAAMKALGDTYEGSRNLISDLTAAMTAGDMEKSKTLADKVIQSGGVLVQAGGNLLLQYGKAMILLPKMAIEQIIPGGKSYTGQEFLCEYAGSILPVFAVGLVGQKLLFRNKGIFRVLADSLAYPLTMPYNGAKISKSIFDRVMKGDLAGILRDPAVSVKDGFFGMIKKNFGRFPFTGELMVHGELQKMRGLLHRLKWETDLNLHKSIIKTRDSLNKIVRNSHDQSLLKKLLGGSDNISLDFDTPEKLIKQADISIEALKKKLTPEAIAQLREEAAKAADRGELRTNTSDLDALEKQRNDLDAERTKLDDRRNKLETEIDEGEKKGKDMSKQKKRLAEMKISHNEIFVEHGRLRENIDALARGESAPHTINTGKIGKMKIRGKGLLGVAAVLGAGVVVAKGIDAIKGDSKSYRDKSAEDILAEGAPDEDDIDYFGYEDSSDAEEDETTLSEYHCETPKDFEKKLDTISASYSEELQTFFTQVEEGSPATPETINKICDSHEKKIGEIKKLLGHNKGMMTTFWKDKFTSPETGEEIIPDDLRKGGFKAFMFIHKNSEGKFLLDTMNKQDLKNVLTQIYNSSDKQDFFKKNLGNTAGTGVDIGLRVAPFTGSAMSGVDAVQDFKNGNVSSGFWNVGWCVAGFALDIGGLVTLGGTTAVGTGLRIAKTGAVMAAHTGVLLAGQGAEQYFTDVRSETIEIDSLSETN